MKLRARISLVAILSLGIFAAIAGIVRQTESNVFAQPEPWIHDTYTMWNFIELEAGIIAASLPGLKPLFSWFYGSARSRNQDKPTTYQTPNTFGYRKQTNPSDSQDFAMIVYGEGQSVQITTNPSEKSVWVRNSEESILPRSTSGDKSGGIRVTREVQVV
jgi:hypothetical protein